MSSSLTAVILAAGHGTRMRSRTPKVLHMVCGRPMIDWVIDAVGEAGADSITVVVNPHHAELAAHLSEKDPTIEVVYQREPKGTAHALQQVEGLKGDVLVVNGDSPLLTSSTIKRVVAAHRGAKRPATLAGVVDPTRDDGRIVRGSDGEFEKIVERKDADDELRQTVHEFNVGIYCFDGGPLKEALAKISNANKAGEYYLTDVFSHIRPVNIVTLADPNEAMGVKDRARVAAATEIMQRRILERLMEDGVTIVDPHSTFIDADVSIGQDTVVEPFSIIKGKTSTSAASPSS
ncbi:MAG: hypothetical protein E6I23_01755 [Chloroflexi bacterium]|nr:MAG: hypothetical protein E6I23_01755 [Chloroflexota bacterium]